MVRKRLVVTFDKNYRISLIMSNKKHLLTQDMFYSLRIGKNDCPSLVVPEVYHYKKLFCTEAVKFSVFNL